jgi:hypothetical protein
MNRTMFVLWWKYPDGSSCGVSRIYQSAEAAQRDLVLLKEHSDVDWKVTEVEVL